MTLVIQQLAHRYGEVHALRGVSAAAAPGKVTAILGPNAAGKSTLLRCIIGAIRPTSGAALIDGKPAHHMSAYHVAQRVAYVPQRSIVSASFTVREVVELGRYALPANRAIIDEAIERMELKEVEDRPYPALSVGQQQRVTLGRALAQLGGVGQDVSRHAPPTTSSAPASNASASNARQDKPCPPLLVLDEPMSAMDLRHVRDTVRLLRVLAATGVTILIAMHDLALAARMADEAWLLNDGRLAAAGTAGEVLNVDVLREVFGVGFEWGKRDDGTQILVSAV